MLRNEVWQFSGVALRVLLYPGRGYHLPIGQTQRWPRRWKSGENVKILAIAGLGCLLLKTYVHHFPTPIGAHQHAEGLHKSGKWVNGAKITRFACNMADSWWFLRTLTCAVCMNWFGANLHQDQPGLQQHFCICSKYIICRKCILRLDIRKIAGRILIAR